MKASVRLLKEVICDKLGGRVYEAQSMMYFWKEKWDPSLWTPDLLEDGVALPEQLCLVLGSPK